MVSRRTMIAGGAGAAVLAVLGYRAWDRGAFTSGEGPAFEAWRDWKGHAGEGPTRPLHAAILASSAHNAQPWIFEPHEDSITVYADLSRNLGAADPFRRELYQSIGCAIANLNVAAAPVYATRTDWSSHLIGSRPQTGVVKLAEVTLARFEPGVQPSDETLRMRAAIPQRHTNRGPYRTGPDVIPYFLERPMLDVAQPYPPVCVIKDAAQRRNFGALIVDATKRFIADKQMADDSAQWFRTGRREVEARRDGINTDGAGLSPVMGFAAKLLPDQDAKSADNYWLASTRDVQVPNTPAFAVIFVPDRLSIGQAISVGGRWQSLHLLLTASGLAAQPMNAPIEMMDRDHFLGRKNDYAKEIRKIAGAKEGDPAFIFRLGYAERPAVASPRRRLQDVIKATA